jgi:Protein of unknown function (DUF1552)
VAAAWPVVAGRARFARAAGGAPLRLVLWPSLNGADPQFFWPNPGNLAAMSAITSPLAPYQRQITFLRGIDIIGSFNHMAVRSMFTGFPVADYGSPDPTVQSLDQVVADHFAATGPTPLRSLHLGAVPADSIELYQLYGRSTFFFSPTPVDYEANPVTAFDRSIKGVAAPAPAPNPGRPPVSPPPAPVGPAPAPVGPSPVPVGPSPAPVGPSPVPVGPSPVPVGPAPVGPVSYDNEVFDLVDAELAELATRVKDAPNELRKVVQHRAASKNARPLVPASPAAAAAPGSGGRTVLLAGACDNGPLASVEKLRPALQGNAAAAYQHQYFSDVFDAQVDIMSRALVCGLTRVATLQAGSADGNVTDPVGPGYPHHMTSHGPQQIFAQCQNWYATKFLRLLQNLDVPDPLDPSGQTVLYNSVVLWMSECLPIDHGSTSVPTFVAGNAGGALRAGGYLELQGATNKALLQTIAQMMGVGASTSGQFGSDTISELRT